MVDVQTVSIAIASASVVAGVVYYAFQLRHQTKIRQTDLVMRLCSTYGGKEYTEALARVLAFEYEDYNDFVKKCGPNPFLNPKYVAFRMISVFAEELGMLLKRGLITPDLIIDLFSVELLWEKLKPIVEGVRRQFNEPRIFQLFEYIYNEVKKREQRK
jgi:hypothetical protein